MLLCIIWNLKSAIRCGSSLWDWVGRVSFLVEILGEKIIIWKQPSGGSLKIFPKFLIDTSEEEHCRLLACHMK